MTERLSAGLRNDPVFLRPGETIDYYFTFQLLRHLRLRDASRGEQEAGIREWLATHEPHPTLVRSLGRNDFGHLLIPKSA